ncbi:MAG: hypothetical protein AVDCRST_MAG70-2044 [uncultured Thermomicrobiales bacterium]|uniref:HTH deoR-type domain-containing protein n=1 Tax=uncultured Thermomicrobiales bacterium TaxID=1645740 RepID=A0A6J4V0M1_9BACT|nr:MAG: hypothetical protein AVDCRST_MAG70-2044 [uncultured Thermomicrobiales bacterium]
MTGITLVLGGGPETAAALAKRFEVSRRTILRDIDALGQIGVPIVATHGPGGGYSLAEGYGLPAPRLTPAEAAVTFLAFQALGPDTRDPFGQECRSVIEKLRAAMSPGTLALADHELASVSLAAPTTGDAPGTEHFNDLRKAIRERLWVRATYASARRVATHLLLPRRLVGAEGRWYCHAVSMAAGEERRYRLDRFSAVVTIPPPDGAAEALLRAARGRLAYDHPGHPEVVIHLSYRGRRQAEGLGLDESAYERVAPHAWRLRFRCPPDELPYYAREILAMGTDALVLAPDDLRDLVVARAEATLRLYAVSTGEAEKR